MARVGIELSTQMGEVEALMDLLDDEGELRGDVAAEIVSMIKLNQKHPPYSAGTVSSTSHRLSGVAVCVYLRGKEVGR